MTLLHPASTGSPVSMWFVDGVPVRLASGGDRFAVVDEPRCADINGHRYWRLRARSADGAVVTLDVREAAGGWVLAGVDSDTDRTGRL